MRMTQMIHRTLREAPADFLAPGAQKLLRAGYLRLGPEASVYLPQLGLRAQRLLAEQVNQVLERNGAQEFETTSRDPEAFFTHLAHSLIQSYKQLPVLLFSQGQMGSDADPRPQADRIADSRSIVGIRYSMSQAQRQTLDQALVNDILQALRDCGLQGMAIPDGFDPPGTPEDFVLALPHPEGAQRILQCPQCGYLATQAAAARAKEAPAKETPAPIEKVHTPDAHTIAALAAVLNIDTARTAKAVFMMATRMLEHGPTETLIMAILRGDMALNERKLARAINARQLRPASESEILAVGAVPGFASPIGVRNVLVVVDDLIPNCPNLAAGANEIDQHFANVNYGRDYTADIVTDLALVEDGAPCPHCQHALQIANAMPLGSCQGILPDASSTPTFLDTNGKAQPVHGSLLQIHLGRILLAIAETHHDDDGLLWPPTLAPFQVHLVALRGGEAHADDLYAGLQSKGYSVLYDDRDARPGVKFKDADLIGLPLRLTVSKRSLEQDAVEAKLRRESDRELIPLDEAMARTKELLQTA